MSASSSRQSGDANVHYNRLYDSGTPIVTTATNTSGKPAPFPPEIPPSLTRSTLMRPGSPSNSSQQQPLTPTRGRYPRSLSHVPLHRRGTSKTYECLEDLLREAGYKETRVFSPESERLEAEEHSRISGMKGGMGIFVDFLTGLIPGGNRSPDSQGDNQGELSGSPTPRITSLRTPSPPPSPLAHKRKFKVPHDIPGHPYRGTSLSGASIVPTDYIHPLKHELSHQSRPQHRSTDPSQAHSKAHAYLRHMASAPAIHQNTTIIPEDDDARGRMQGEPPLPRTWIENVTRAVLFGGTAAHFGGPVASGSSLSNSINPPPPTHRARPLRQSRSTLSGSPRKLSKRALADYTNIHLHPSSPLVYSNTRLAVPAPALFGRIQNTRSRRSEGEVSRTRVMCRSTPGSRSGSKVRDGSERDGHGSKGREKGRTRSGYSASGHGSRSKTRQAKGRDRQRGRKLERDGVPSLARTTTEGDVMWTRNQANDGKSRYLSGWGVETDTESEFDSQSSEEEGELDLARMLVPPKRQNSIRSLRKHLAGSPSGAGDRGGSLKGSLRSKWLTPGIGNGNEDGEDNWGRWGLRKGMVDDEVDGGISGGDGVGKRRLGIPAWRGADG